MKTRFAELRQQVLDANVSLSNRGMAPFTFGNVSGIDRAENAVVIKPSGVKYDAMTRVSVGASGWAVAHARPIRIIARSG